MATSKYLTKRETALRFDVSTRTIDRLRAEGELEWMPVRGCVRITVASIEAYEQRQNQHAYAAGGDPFAIPALEAIRAEKDERRSAARVDEEQAA
jgi:hypothetical protein